MTHSSTFSSSNEKVVFLPRLGITLYIVIYTREKQDTVTVNIYSM